MDAAAANFHKHVDQDADRHCNNDGHGPSDRHLYFHSGIFHNCIADKSAGRFYVYIYRDQDKYAASDKYHDADPHLDCVAAAYGHIYNYLLAHKPSGRVKPDIYPDNPADARKYGNIYAYGGDSIGNSNADHLYSGRDGDIYSNF